MRIAERAEVGRIVVSAPAPPEAAAAAAAAAGAGTEEEDEDGENDVAVPFSAAPDPTNVVEDRGEAVTFAAASAAATAAAEAGEPVAAATAAASEEEGASSELPLPPTPTIPGLAYTGVAPGGSAWPSLSGSTPRGRPEVVGVVDGCMPAGT
jgi:ribosomal protein L12E/L44/L45/RPP1/RPP2